MGKIQTFSGRIIDLENPNPKDIAIEDIAIALSRTCRFAGHTQYFYSVAQHSYLVSKWCSFPLEGLLHDAAEAYCVDVPKPLKNILPDYQKIEKDVELAIAKAFQIRFPLPEEVKLVDKKVFNRECIQFMKGDWIMEHTKHLGMVDEVYIRPLPPEDAYHLFMEQFKKLTKNRVITAEEAKEIPCPFPPETF